MSFSFPSALRWWARETPDATAIQMRGDVVTYDQLDQWVNRAAFELQHRGVGCGDRVSIVGNNSIEWAIPYIAALRLGAIVAPFNHRLVTSELNRLMSLYEPKVVVTGEEHITRVSELSAFGHQFDLVPLLRITELREGARVHFDEPHLDPDQVALLLHTSGTTGDPKAAVYSHRTIESIVFEWGLLEPGLSSNCRILCLLPMAMFGGTWCIVQALHNGGVMVLEPTFEPEQALRALVEQKITGMFATPVFWDRISMVPGFDDADLSTLKCAMIGGAPVPVPVLRRWRGKQVLLRQSYGSTEAAPGTLMRAGAEEHPQLCGRGGIFTDFRIVRPDGSLCEVGEVGEVVVRGPSTCLGYFRNEEATRELIRDGWLHMGDLGVANADGNIRIVDRIKDIVISGGFNISPKEVENVIHELPQVHEVAVIGVPDSRFGETPAAIVRVREPIMIEEIVAYCNVHLADYKVPRYVVIRDEEFPRNPMGKIQKADLKKVYANLPETHARVR